MRWLLAGLSAVVVTLGAGVVAAQESAGESTETSGAGSPSTSEADRAQEVRRDPKGITGISPFWEAVREGDRAYVARSFSEAIEAYKKAIAAEPSNPMGHYRVGQAHVANNQLEEAEAAYVAALRYASNDPQLKAKVLFVLADLRERQQDYPGATERWDTYAAHVTESKTLGYSATPAARKQVIAKWQELKAQYAEVKERIKKREEEAERKLKKSSM